MTTETQQTPEQIEKEANEAFASGHAAVRGTTAPPVAEAPAPDTPAEPQKEPVSAAPATEAAPAVAEVDEWAGVSPKVKEEIDAIRGQLASVGKVNERLRAIDGHIGGLTATTKEMKASLAAALVQAKTATEGAGKDTPTQQQIANASASDTLWKQLTEDYPDWAKAVDDRLKKLETDRPAPPPPVDTAALKSEVTADVDKRIASASSDAQATARVYAYLDFKHGLDWETKIKTKDFETWFGKQPADVKALSGSNKAADASKLISLYETHLAKSAEKTAEQVAREKRLDGAVQPTGVHVSSATQEDPEAAFRSGYKAVRGG